MTYEERKDLIKDTLTLQFGRHINIDHAAVTILQLMAVSFESGYQHGWEDYPKHFEGADGGTYPCPQRQQELGLIP